MHVNACENSQIQKAATVFQRKVVGVTNETFSGRVNSRESSGCKLYLQVHALHISE